MTNGAPNTKISQTFVGVSKAMGVPGLLGFPTLARMLIEMINLARHWEQMEEARERCGLDSEPAPFHWTVMGHLERVNKQRRAAQRQQMEKQLQYRQKQAKIARRRDSLRPNISRRVENERRNKNRAAAEGTIEAAQ